VSDDQLHAVALSGGDEVQPPPTPAPVYRVLNTRSEKLFDTLAIVGVKST
jgi:hypothetical protein